ncbi:hypothetical protein AWC38_SpisGene24189 [Stylophora pistillata]|uniref:Uncharacterized protein n=1 Tax=Stylophora pistillata TaxID=50429 RepID=A0A2B4R2S8_STYPI|nr:hypothetical protein AWC38_SpisGene24189 [Stylophora pistillata]
MTEKSNLEARNSAKNTAEGSNGIDLTSVVLGLQNSIAQLTRASETQAEAFHSLKDEIFLQLERADTENEEDEPSGAHVDPTAAMNNLIADASKAATAGQTLSGGAKNTSASGADTDILDSLTQALISNTEKFKAVDAKIASLIDNILTGDLPEGTAKEKGEKYPPPENCEHLPEPTIDQDDLRRKCLTFQAGLVSQHSRNWELLTSDPVILDAIKHYHIEFEVEFPQQTMEPKSILFSNTEFDVVSSETSKLLSEGVIECTESKPDDYLSNIFVRPKKDGTCRVILNLKPINEFVDYHHFKMDTFHTALTLVRRNCSMASVDLIDAHYSILIATEHPSNLTLKLLTQKLIMLVALVSAQRGQSLHMLDLDFMKENNSVFEFVLSERIKQSRPGYTPPSVSLKAFPHDDTLCVHKHMKEYVAKTKPLRESETKLCISYVKPHHMVSRETISRWIRQVMFNAGKDVFSSPIVSVQQQLQKPKLHLFPCKTF